MAHQRFHVLGQIVTGDVDGIHALRHMTDDESRVVLQTAAEQGISGFEGRKGKYQVKRNADYTFEIVPADDTGGFI